MIDNENKRLILGCQSSVIPNDGSVTSIGGNAFSDCTGLTSITIPDSVTSIGGNAFSWCSGLTSIEIPDSVTSIGRYAFYGCTGLTNIEIPDSVASIDRYAFDDCRSLTSINYSGTQKQWNSIANIGNAGIPQGCTIHCTDGDIVVK